MTTKSKGSAIASVKKVKQPVDKALKREEITSKVTPRNKQNLLEEVISNREVKYKYPEDVNDTLSRKSWRQRVRDRINTLKLALLDVQDQDSKEYKKALKELENYQKQVLK